MKPDAGTWLKKAPFVATCCIFCLVCGFGYRYIANGVSRYYFDSWTEDRRFDRQAWLAKVTYEDGEGVGVRYLRGMMVHDIERRYECGKTTPKQILALLGTPDKRRKYKSGLAAWGYELGNWESNRSNYLTFYFNSGKVQASSLEWDDYDE